MMLMTNDSRNINLCTDEDQRKMAKPCYDRGAGVKREACGFMAYSDVIIATNVYEEESKSFRTGRLELELQMVQLSATRCSCIAIL
jgi:hypothetical protein